MHHLIGRIIDPPLRSRFQCRYIDELATTTILNNIHIQPPHNISNHSNSSQIGGMPPTITANATTTTPHDINILRKLSHFYEGLTALRTEIIKISHNSLSTVLSSIPVFSLQDIQYCYNMSKNILSYH